MSQTDDSSSLGVLFESMCSSDPRVVERSLQTFYREYAPRMWTRAHAVFRSCGQIREPGSEAEEVVAIVFAKFPEAASGFRFISDAASVAWLNRVVLNSALTHKNFLIGRNQSFESLEEQAEYIGEIIDRAQEEQVDELEERLDALRAGGPRERRMAQAAELYQKGYRYRDIADTLGIGHGTIRNLMADLFVYLGRPRRTTSDSPRRQVNE